MIRRRMNMIERWVNCCKEENLQLLYAQLRQGGEVREEYSFCPHKTRLNAMSVSKSFVSAAVGIAQEEGLLSLDEKICDAFPEAVPASANSFLLETNLRHMLTMTTGLAKPLFFADSPERYVVKDWISYFFNAEFDHAPGEKFLYSNFNTYMLCCLVEKRAGVNLLEYLRYRLFEPIGIGNPDWTLCPKGHCYAANGLYINIDELGLFGELLLRNGNWNGQQLIPADYLRQATVKQVETRRDDRNDVMSHGYGYQIWMNPIENTFSLCGNYGQYCLVIPEKETVVSCMSLEGNNYRRIYEHLLQIVKEEIL